MIRKLPTFLVKYVLLANGEEYPHEILIDAANHSEAKIQLYRDVKMVGTCDLRIKDVTRYYPNEL